MRNVGLSWMLDLSGVCDDTYHTRDTLVTLLQKAVEVGNLEQLAVSSHQFDQQLDNLKKGGSTVVILLAESHISAHTWPEHDRLVIDLFSCGPPNTGQQVIDYLLQQIPHDSFLLQKLPRGDNR